MRVVYTKYDGTLHWHHTMEYLGQDEHGVWLGARAGSTSRRGSKASVVLEQPYVGLMPSGQWWTAAFNGEPSDTEIYCDISTLPHWPDEHEVTMVDLDLDVVRVRPGPRVLVIDEDEFADNRVRYAYPAEVISQAEQAAAWLHAAISGGKEPFATTYRVWLDQVS